MSAPVSAGIHYIEVKGYGVRTAGDYTLWVSFSPDNDKPTPPDDDAEPLVATVVPVIGVGDTAGVLRHGRLPRSTGGPDVRLSGNHSVISGGAFFIEVEPESGSALDKLLISFAGDDSGYYELDLQEIAASYNIVGQIAHDVDPTALQSFSLSVVAVDRQQGIGRPTNHEFDVIEVGTGKRPGIAVMGCRQRRRLACGRSKWRRALLSPKNGQQWRRTGPRFQCRLPN